jgi:hypothetical protein
MSGGIDRVTPTRRPERRADGWQRWRDLAFLHWPMPVEVLRRVVPRSLEIDCFEGQAYVGLVLFAMQAVRPRWAPFALDFLETNVRTYVHRDGRDPGVYFLSLDAASWLAVRAARAGWGLPYFHARMSLERTGDGGAGTRIEYATERRSAPRSAARARWRVGAELGPSLPGSLQHFLVERYLLHLERGGRLQTGQVHHAPYPVHGAELIALDESLIAAAGLPAPAGPPPLVHASPGVDVEIFGLRQR